MQHREKRKKEREGRREIGAASGFLHSFLQENQIKNKKYLLHPLFTVYSLIGRLSEMQLILQVLLIFPSSTRCKSGGNV